MGVITAAQFVSYTDKLARYYLAYKGTVGTGYGLGDSSQVLGSDWGASLAARQLENLVIATGDGDQITALQGAFRLLEGGFARFLPSLLSRPMIILGQDCRKAAVAPGVGTIDKFAGYYNIGAGGPYTALLCPDFATTYSLATSGGALSASNVYSPNIASMYQQVIGGASTPGTAVTTASYAGAGLAQLQVSGFTGASGLVTVTGSARLANGTIAAGHTFTATVAANGNFTLAPTVAGDLLTSVSSVSAAVAILTGTLIVACLPPAGRSNPPT